jgi:hypothetical protein
MSNGLFLTIGDVVLSGLEIPEELGELGTQQTLVKHKFPGGIITIQPLGAFPQDTISWTGILTGTDAFARSQQLQRIAALGNEVTLSYGTFAWTGYVGSFSCKPKHQWLVPYTLVFEPIADLSGVGTVPFAPDSPESLLSGAVSSVQSLIGGDDGLPLPGTLGDTAQAMLDAVSTGLINGDGTVAGISATDAAAINVAAVAVENACLPYSLGTNPANASPALDLNVQAVSINQIVGNPTSGVRLVQTVNPNLFAVAAQYLGDARLWPSICAASNLPPDPQPVGAFTLTVPA